MTARQTTFFPDDGDTLARARAMLNEQKFAVEGTVCPCCDRYAKVYPRQIHTSMARWLIQLVRRYSVEPRWYAVREPWALRINSGTGDTAKLRYWSMIEHRPKGEGDEKKKDSGKWKPTRIGVDFVHGLLPVPKYALEWDAECLGLDGDLVTIADCLGAKFDYRELMNEPIR